MADFVKIQGRERFVQFIKIGAMEAYSILGEGSEDISIEYSAQSQTYKWVTQKNGKTVTTGYEMTSGVEQYVQTDDPLFTAIDGLRRKLATTTAIGTILNVALYMGEEPALTGAADEHDISISFNQFGGSSDNPLVIGYTINYNGDPRPGVATLVPLTKSATFAPTV